MTVTDIKPDNIIVVKTDTNPNFSPVLIDLIDYSSGPDGSRHARAYSPPSGSRFERDRFAITKITEEIITQIDHKNFDLEIIKTAIVECRNGPPQNASLLPLREAIVKAKALRDNGQLQTFLITFPRAENRPFHADEGNYTIIKTERGFRILGATETLFVDLDSTGNPIRVTRSQIDQLQLQKLLKRKICSFSGEIITEDGFNNFESINYIIELSGISELLTESTEQQAESEQELEASQLVEIESEEYSYKEELNAVFQHAFDMNIPLLWERSIQVESEFKVEVIAIGDSTYREESRLHLIPIQASFGEMDFDRSDLVIVEKLDNRKGWLKVGTMEVQKSFRDTLAIHGYANGYGGSIVRDGDRLRFQSRLENTSLQRRNEAITRILKKNSVTPSLLDYFDQSSLSKPLNLLITTDDNHLIDKYELNDSQIHAFKGIISNRPLGLLQGPPGTGKTRFIGALIHYALTNGLANNVLLASQSHEAVNNAAETVLKLFGTERDNLSMIRVGAEGQVSEALQNYHVATVEKAYKDKFTATRHQRISIIASYLGLSSDICDSVLFFEDTLRPILNRITDLAESNDDSGKIESLIETIDHLLQKKGIFADLTNCNSSDLEQNLSTLYFSKLPLDDAHQIERLRHIAELGRDIVGTVSTYQRSYETFLAGTRQIVAGTCVGLGRSALGLTKTPFDLVIVDEAARCTSSELAVPIQAGKWIVLVGDQAQLEPLHSASVVETLTRELKLPASEIIRSDFERVFDSTYGKTAGFTLKRQHRMLPAIGRLISNSFYDKGLQHGRTTAEIPQDVMPPELIKPLTWISTDTLGNSAFQTKDSLNIGSLQNIAEAEVIVSLIKNWSKHEPFLNWTQTLPEGTKAIGIICAYAAQLDLIRKKLRIESLPDTLRRSIIVDTIDSYQGKENLIAIVSLVRNNADGVLVNDTPSIKPGFMSKKNRINVALSRGKDRLIMIGAKGGWPEKSPLGFVSSNFDEEVKAGEALLIEAKDLIYSSKEEINSSLKNNEPSIFKGLPS